MTDKGGADQVQSRMDEIHAKGYEGTVPDKTPNEAYTVTGSVKAEQEKTRGSSRGRKSDSEQASE